MNDSIKQLSSIASGPLVRQAPIVEASFLSDCEGLGEQLLALLSERNGFYAFESALHVYPAGRSSDLIDVETWNSLDLWRSEYDDMTSGCIFFAEDVFGGQFCIRSARIYTFDPETGDLGEFATTFPEWAQRILDDYKPITGFSLAHEWQRAIRPLRVGERLIPKIPFVCGGEFTIANLYAGDAVEGMRFRGSIARQIRDLPDGASINLKVE